MGPKGEKKFFIVGATIILVLSLNSVSAASLNYSPPVGSYEVGQTLSLTVKVNSEGRSINAVSGVVSFPQDKLRATSVSKTNSIINFWVQEPSFSNTLGSINFEGVVLNPGFTGSSGTIITISFRVIAAGSANISFGSGSVLANDGQGTNVLSGLGSANFVLGTTPTETTTPSAIPSTPAAPQVKSSSHPDPNAWYSESTAEFGWNNTAGVTAVKAWADNNPQSAPTKLYSAPISSKTVKSLTDGTWYFHLQLQNDKGWGAVSHFRFRIDTQNPSYLSVEEVARGDTTYPKVKLKILAEDEASGIDHYEISIDKQEPVTWEDEGGHVYESTALSPGFHAVMVRAIDKAGNSISKPITVEIKPIETPAIIEYSHRVAEGELLFIEGTVIPGATVTVYQQDAKGDTQTFSIVGNQAGTFEYVTEELGRSGAYEFWLVATDKRGAQSNPSERITVLIEKPAILRLGSLAVNFLAVLIPLIVLFGTLVLVIIYFWHRLKRFRTALKEDLRSVEHDFEGAFHKLKTDVEKEMSGLKQLSGVGNPTDQETALTQRLEQSLDEAEKILIKKIEGIDGK